DGGGGVFRHDLVGDERNRRQIVYVGHGDNKYVGGPAEVRVRDRQGDGRGAELIGDRNDRDVPIGAAAAQGEVCTRVGHQIGVRGARGHRQKVRGRSAVPHGESQRPGRAVFRNGLAA